MPVFDDTTNEFEDAEVTKKLADRPQTDPKTLPPDEGDAGQPEPEEGHNDG